jgi:opacity protein-like surface antigen
MKFAESRRGLQYIFVLVTALGLAAPAMADSQWTVEGFAGYYDPDSFDDNSEIFGARFGYLPSDRFGMLLSVGAIDLEDEFLDEDLINLRADLFLVDLSFQWYPTGRSFYLFAGPGFATVDVEIDLPGPGNDFSDNDSTFTLHGGLGFRWDLGETFFLRPELRARWFDGDDFNADDLDSYDGLDTEYTLGFGWRF